MWTLHALLNISIWGPRSSAVSLHSSDFRNLEGRHLFPIQPSPCWVMRSGSQMVFKFIPKAVDGAEVRFLCRPEKTVKITSLLPFFLYRAPYMYGRSSITCPHTFGHIVYAFVLSVYTNFTNVKMSEWITLFYIWFDVKNHKYVFLKNVFPLLNTFFWHGLSYTHTHTRTHTNPVASD